MAGPLDVFRDPGDLIERARPPAVAPPRPPVLPGLGDALRRVAPLALGAAAPATLAARGARAVADRWGTDFGEARRAQQLSSDVADRADSHDLYAERAGREIVAALAARGITEFTTPYGRRIAITPRQFRRDREGVSHAIWMLVDAERRADPEFLRDVPDADAFDALVTARRAGDRETAEARLAATSGLGATAGALVGGMQSLSTDPLTLITTALAAPFGGPVAGGLARQMGSFALREAAINAAVNAPFTVLKADNLRSIGEDYGAGEAAIDLGIAAAFGGALGAALPLASRGLDARARARAAAALERENAAISAMTDRDMARELERRFPDPGTRPEDVRDAIRVLDIQAAIDEGNPLGPAAAAHHRERLALAAEAVDEGAPVRLPPLPAEAAPAAADPGPRLAMAAQALADREVRRFRPAELGVDAERFQFKSGGDAAGVTERLQGVQRWDPMLSGKAVVWEDADGRHWIVDGHQRLGLARRAAAAGQEGVYLDAVVLREADGVSDVDARVMAAQKNIAEGTGSAVDAAKVLRAIGPDAALNLPPRSTLVRDAQGLMALSDDAFVMVVNERVAPGHAAILGRLAPDRRDVHAPLLELLARTEPRTAAEAEGIVRQALAAPVRREVQTDMFGSLIVERPLFLERAQVLDHAGRLLKTDHRTFGTLEGNASAIEAAGNVLARDTNRALSERASELQGVLQALATRRGAVSDALDAAAGALADGAPPATAARRFLDDLGTIDWRAADDGGTGGAGAGSGNRAPGAADGDGRGAGGGGRDVDAGGPRAGAVADEPGRAAGGAGDGPGTGSDGTGGTRPGRRNPWVRGDETLGGMGRGADRPARPQPASGPLTSDGTSATGLPKLRRAGPTNATDALAEATAGLAVRDFDEGGAGAAARAQTDRLLHELRAAEAETPGLRLALEDDGAERPLAELLADIDADRAAIRAVRDCLL